MNWFLYASELRHERVKQQNHSKQETIQVMSSNTKYNTKMFTCKRYFALGLVSEFGKLLICVSPSK